MKCLTLVINDYNTYATGEVLQEEKGIPLQC